MNFESPDPKHRDRVAKLAFAMSQLTAEASLSGLRFADLAEALAMMKGMLLAGAYRNHRQREIAARKIAKAAVDRAASFAERMPPYRDHIGAKQHRVVDPRVR
jgi:hypothetical protein